MNMKLWTHKTNAAAVGGSPSSAAAAAAAAVSARTKPAVEDQFKALVELTIQELTSARRELAAAVEEAKKMRAASAPTMPTHSNSNGNGNGSSRCRSLSSTWETTDSDDEGDDESDVEEYDDDDPMHLAAPGATTKQERDALLAAQRRALFMTDCDFDDDTEHEESKDEFFDLAHARDVASLARAASTNTLPILNRLMGNGSSSSSSSSSTSANGEDATTATYPSALPAVRVSGRRRSNSRNRSSRRRRTRSESAASGISNGSSSHNNSSSSSHTGGLTRERRLRILSPIASKIFFSGWVRGQPAEVLWEVFDKSVQFVRIDVCNVDWKEPTIMARQEPNDGHFQWKKVVWGLPIKEGYYVNIYDATQPEDFYADGQLPLLAQSERFAVTG